MCAGDAVVVMTQTLQFTRNVISKRIGNFQMMATNIYLHEYILIGVK
jgi:hypothetical protein